MNHQPPSSAIRPIRTLLVDDEELARRVLRELLQRHSDIEVVGECANGFEAVKSVAELGPDLLFLDIQMPKLDGFEVLELIGPGPVVIFATAYDQHALRAFEVHAVDYLLKPIAPARFEAALERVRLRLREQSLARFQPPPGAPVPAVPAAQRHAPAAEDESAAAGDSSPDPALPASSPTPLELAASARPPGSYAERIVVKDGTRVIIIPVAKLDYVEAQDDYLCLASQGHKHLKQQTISSLEAMLDPRLFLRIHRSYLVNLERVAKLEPYGKDSHLAILGDGSRLPVSRAGYARLKSLL